MSELKIAEYRLSGPHGAECVIDEGEGAWFGYATVALDGEYALSNGTAPASPTKWDAIIDACEGLIAWLSEQKEKGSKRHRKQAEEVQNWALDLVSKTRAERDAAADVDAQTGTADDQWTDVAPIRTALHASANSSVPQLFPLDRLHESPLNPRQHIPEASIEELAASMRQSGFRPWLPIVARLRPDGDGDIAAGHRRRLAAIRAGLTHVPVLLQEMTDEEFLDILNFDNAGREDVHPLHEAAGWRTWMEKTGKGVLDIAARIGQSKEYVYQRLKYADLIPEAQAAFLDGKITSSHAILIARLSPDDQRLALRACEPSEWEPDQKVSSRELASWIKKNLHIDLRKALFSCADAELVPIAGSCIDCPYRVGNAPDFNPSADLPDVCTRPSCYDAKLEAHLAAQTKRMQNIGGVLVSEGHSTRREGVLAQGAWHRCGESAVGAKPALIVEGANRGELIFVLLQETLAFQQPTAPPPPKPKKAKRSAEEIERARKEHEDFIAQQKRDLGRREAEEQKRQRQIDLEKSIREQIAKAIVAKVDWPPKREDVLRLLDESEVPDTLDDLLESISINPRDWTRASMQKLSPANLARLVVLIAIADDFDEWTFSRGCEQLMAAAKRYGVNAAKIRADAEKAAKEAEGGTRKEVIGQLPAVNGQEKSDPVTEARLKVACPQCHAKAGEPCTNYKGQRCHPHGVRKAPKSADAAKPKPAARKEHLAEARKRIAAAQKKRWALHRRQQAAKKGGKK